jgi:hypothetical protein
MVAPGGRWRNTIALKLLGNKLKRQKRKMFFSEEKNQKTFISPPPPNIEAMAGMLPQRRK